MPNEERSKEFTVFYCDKNSTVLVNTLDYFLEKGKTYEDVQKRLQENPDWVEKQDKILWSVTRMWEKRKERLDKYENALHLIDEIMIDIKGDEWG